MSSSYQQPKIKDGFNRRLTDDENESSDEECNRFRAARPISHYRIPTPIESSSSLQQVAVSDDDNIEPESRRRRRPSNSSNNNNDDESSSDDEYYQSRARPISHYLRRSVTPSTSNLESEYANAQDHGLPDEDNNENECGLDNSDFYDSDDSIPKPPRYSEGTLNVALQDHEEIDYDEKINMTNEDGSCKDTLALANQKTLCFAPTRCAKTQWPTDLKESFNKKIIYSLNAFRNSKYSWKTVPKRPINLVITDSMMSSIPFEKIYKNTVKLFVGYPNDPFDVIKQINSQIEKMENDYIIKNILLCIGFDSLVYYPNFDEAIDDTNKFLNQISNVIKKAFDKNGPKRYKHVRDDEDEEDEIMEKEEPTPISIEPPKIIVVTIPEISNHPTAFTYNIEIAKMNKAITKYVESAKDLAFKKHNIIFELYDWAKHASSKFDQCTKQDLLGRNRILTVDLAVHYTWFMIPRIAENPDAIKLCYNESLIRQQKQTSLENEKVITQKNKGQNSKIISKQIIRIIDDGETNDETIKSSEKIFNEDFLQTSTNPVQNDSNDLNIKQRLRKRKATASLHNDDISFPKKIPKYCCVPRPYIPQKFEKSIIYPSNFHFFYEKKNSLKALIFDDAKKSCYKFSYIFSHKAFFCEKCFTMKKVYSIRFRRDDTNGKEYFTHCNLNHICKPLNYLEAIENKELLSSSAINLENDKSKKATKIPKGRKVDSQLCKFQRNANNKLHLLIYTSKEKLQWFDYYYKKDKCKFICSPCNTLGKYVYAAHVKDESSSNDENDGYVILGNQDHVCQPFSVFGRNYVSVMTD